MNTETPNALYAHLGPFSDLVAAARALGPLFPSAPSGLETRRRAREVLHFTVGEERPRTVSTERNWRADGVDGEGNLLVRRVRASNPCLDSETGRKQRSASWRCRAT